MTCPQRCHCCLPPPSVATSFSTATNASVSAAAIVFDQFSRGSCSHVHVYLDFGNCCKNLAGFWRWWFGRKLLFCSTNRGSRWKVYWLNKYLSIYPTNSEWSLFCRVHLFKSQRKSIIFAPGTKNNNCFTVLGGALNIDPRLTLQKWKQKLLFCGTPRVGRKPRVGHPNSGITTLHTKVTTLYGTLAGRVATRKHNGFSST